MLGVDGHDLGTRGASWPVRRRAPRRSATPCWPGPAAARPPSAASVTGSPAKPDHGVEHHLAEAGHGGQSLGPGEHLGARWARADARAAARVGVADGDHLGPEARAWAASTSTERHVAEGDDPETLGLGRR